MKAIAEMAKRNGDEETAEAVSPSLTLCARCKESWELAQRI